MRQNKAFITVTYFSRIAGWKRMCNGHCTSYWSLTQSQPDMTTADESVDNKKRQLETSKEGNGNKT